MLNPYNHHMLKCTRLLSIGGLICLLFFPACSKDSFKNSGDAEKKSVAPPPQTSNQEKNLDEPVARVVYEIKVNANTGLELCTGVGEFLLAQNFNLSPSGLLHCLIKGQVDLATMFARPQVPMRKEEMSQFKHFGKIARAENPENLAPGLSDFSPPRPSFLGPIIQDPSDFSGFVYKEESQVRGISKDGQNYQDSGQWFIQVHEIGLNFHPEGYQGPITFPQTMRWEIKAAGFQNSPRSDFMGYDSITYWYNTSPQIAVPKIEIKAKLADVLGSEGGGGGGVLASIGDLIFSGVTITLIVREHNPL